eukprot:33638_5
MKILRSSNIPSKHTPKTYHGGRGGACIWHEESKLLLVKSSTKYIERALKSEKTVSTICICTNTTKCNLVFCMCVACVAC